MSETITTTISSPIIDWKEGRNAQERTISQQIHFSNKYTYDESTSEVKKVEIVVYDNALGENPVVVGEMVNGKFKPNNNAKNVQFSKKGKNNDRSWNSLNGEMDKDLIKASKNISREPSTLESLNLNNKEKRDEFLKSKYKSKEEDLKDVDDSVNAKNVATNLEALKKKQFRKQYGNFFYPLGIKNNNQDRIKITVVDFIPQSIPPAPNPDGTRDPINFELGRSGEKVIRGSATLPIPNGVSDQNKVDFSDGTLNPAQVAGAQVALNTLLGGIGAGGQALGEGIKEVVKNPNTPRTIASLLTSFALNINPNQLVARTAGGVFNNNLALLFKGPTLRPFNFNFNVSPRDQRESIEVQKIIRMFKQSSAVQRTESGLFLGSPHVYDIEFLSGSSSHKFLPRIKTCALQVFAVNYMPNNTYMTYENSSMVSYSLQFQFKELDPIFNDDYDELDFTDFDEPRITTDPNNEEAQSITFFEQTADSGGIGF